MANAIASLLVNLAADVSNLEKGFDKATGLVDKFDKRLDSMGTALTMGLGGTAIAAGIKNVTDFAGNVSDLAARLDLSTTAVQKFDVAFSQTGSSMESGAKAIETMSRKLVGGDDAMAEALTQVGLNLEDLRKMKAEEAFVKIGDALGKLPGSMERTTLATELLGKSGAELLPAFAAGLTEVGDAAEASGLIMGEKAVAGADELGDNFDKLLIVGRNLIASVLTPFLPLLNALAAVLVPLGGVLGTIVEKLIAWFTPIQKAGEAIKQLTESWKILAGEVTGPALPQAPKAFNAVTVAAAGSKASLAAADKAAKEMDKTFGTAEANLKKTQGAMKSLGDEAAKLAGKFSGADIIKEANAYAIAVVAMGGAAKLTRAEQAELNKILGEALAKYDALGKTAPFAMERLFFETQNATFGVQAFGETAKEAIDKWVASLEKAIPKIQAVGKAWISALPNVSSRGGEISEVLAGGPWDKFLKMNLSGLEAGLAQIFGKVGQQIASFIDAFQTAGRAGEQLKAGGWQNLVSGSLNAAGAIGQATSGRTRAGNVLGGAATGAAAGSAFGPVGAIVGGGIGALVGLFRGGQEKKELAQLRGAFLDAAGGASALREEAKRLGVSFTLIDNVLNAKKLEGYERSVKALEAAFARAQAEAEAFAASLGKVTAAGDLIDPDTLTRLLEGRESDRGAAAEFLSAQTGAALSGIGRYVATRGGVATSLGEARTAQGKARADVEALKVAPKDESASDLADRMRALQEANRLLDETSAKVRTLEGALGALPVTAAGAQAVGGAIAGLFAELQAQGASPLAALQEMGPTIAAWGAQLQAAGLQGGAAFDTISRLAGIASSEIAGPALEAVDGLSSGMVALFNIGRLDQETFAAMTGEIMGSRDALIAQGNSADDVGTLMQASLQRVWQMQKDYGFQVDESTQAILDQMEASGQIGDKFRPAADKMTLALDTMIKRLGEIVELLAKGLPNAGTAATSGLTNTIGSYQPPAIRVPVTFDVDDEGGVWNPSGTTWRPTTALAGGGIVQRPTVALLGERGPEAVVPLGGGFGAQTVNVYLDGRVLTTAVLEHTPRVMNVRGVK